MAGNPSTFQKDASNYITSTGGGRGAHDASTTAGLAGTSRVVGFSGNTFRSISGGDGTAMNSTSAGGTSAGMIIQGIQYKYGGGGGSGGARGGSFRGGKAGLNGIGGSYNANTDGNGQSGNVNSYSSGGGGGKALPSQFGGNSSPGAVIFIFAG
jgi:hypothetical protein